MLKIGLTQRVEVLADRGERWDCLDQGWAHLLSGNGYQPLPLPNRVQDVEAFMAELGLNGVILTGGNDLAHLPGARNAAPERDAFERKLLTCCRDGGIPVLGVCRGLQMMVVHAGGEVSPVTGHVATTHRIAARSDGPMPLADRQVVNSFHDFGVYGRGLGPDLRLVATAPDGSAEAIVHKDLPQWGIMWHPERPPHNERDAHLVQALFEGSRV